MKTRPVLAALALCTGVVFAACAIKQAADETTEFAELEGKLKDLKGDDLATACKAADPKPTSQGACQATVEKTITVTLPSGKKRTIKAKQFVPGECCALENQCGKNPQFNAAGECRKENSKGVAKGAKVPGACCEAACAEAKLDKNGICRTKTGEFAFGSCCLDQCLVFAEPSQGVVQCTAETCNGAADEAQTCFCDAQCVEFGDCCANASAVCELGRNPGNPGNSTCAAEECGGQGNEAGTCFCDAECVNFGDCCGNVQEVCGFRGNRTPTVRGGRRSVGECSKDTCGQNSKADGSGCFCDAACVEFGDCCANAQEICPDRVGGDPRGERARGDLVGTCNKDNCGGPADATSGNTCFCDDQCEQFGDCCSNVKVCNLDQRGRDRGDVVRAGGSCSGACGAQSANGECFCDEQCSDFGDCCADKVDQCGGNGTIPDRAAVPPGLCSADSCGKNSKANGSGCFCDDSCAEFGDCCANKATKCGGPGLDVEVINCGAEKCTGAKLDAKKVCRKTNGEFADAACCDVPKGIKERAERAAAERAARGITGIPGRITPN